MLAASVTLFSTGAGAFQGPGQGQGCMGECTDCHTFNKDEARKLLKTDRFNAEVKNIRMSPVKGLWEVEIAQSDRTVIVYVDFAKQFLVEGRFTPLEKLSEGPELEKVDRAGIPVDRALLIGNPDAENKVIVFDDPDCPYCAKLHAEIKKIVSQRDDIAFLIKMYPLPSHKEAYGKSMAIVCEGDPALLEEAFAGKKLPEADCETDEVDNNLALARELGIKGTPTLILPDGRLVPGYISADVIIGLVDNPGGEAPGE